MWNLGLKSLRLHHRVSVNLSLEENKICEPVELDVGGIKATLAPKRSRLLVPDNGMLRGVKVGAAHVTPSGELVLEPMDFSKKNYISLMDLQDLLIKIVRKDVELNAAPITISEDMRMMLTTAMSQYPSESSNPKYDKSDFPDDYCKFFLPGLARVRRKGALRIFNKIGRAYGFSVDNSYVFDVETGQNFFLSAVIYTNANEIVNDDKYEYDFADTVMADLVEVIARAVWQVPSYVSSKSCPTDCIPSSLLDPCDPPLVQPIVSKAIEVSLQTTSGKQPQLDLQPLPIFGSKIVDCASKNAGIKGASFSLMTDSPGEYESKEENDVRSDIPSSSDSANGLMQIEASIAPHSTTGRKMFADAPEGALDTFAPAQMRSVHNSHDASCDLRAHVTTIWPSCPLNNSDICSIKQNTSEYHLQDVTSSSLGVDLAHYQQKTQIKAQKDSLVDKTYFYFVDQ
ncbi:hypothetical protein O6H91_18G075200 [Diphasiastrum complanatum]|nr:hypothetical protein O6H91_18G075200 [Diphasiastrum complanatum]